MFKLNKLALIATVLGSASVAFADNHEMAADVSYLGLIAIGAGIAVGLAAFGAASAQGNAAKAALEGISRNPSSAGAMFLPLVLSLVFMEALGILAFLVANTMGGTIEKAVFAVLGIQ